MQYRKDLNKVMVFSSSELRLGAPGVYNYVAANDCVIIRHRDRHDMALVRRDYIETLLAEIANSKGQ